MTPSRIILPVLLLQPSCWRMGAPPSCSFCRMRMPEPRSAGYPTASKPRPPGQQQWNTGAPITRWLAPLAVLWQAPGPDWRIGESAARAH